MTLIVLCEHGEAKAHHTTARKPGLTVYQSPCPGGRSPTDKEVAKWLSDRGYRVEAYRQNTYPDGSNRS